MSQVEQLYMEATATKKGAMELKFFPGIKYKMLKTANKWPKVSRMKTLFVAYTLLLFLVSVLPINSSGATINHTFVIFIRMDYLLHCAIFIPWVFLLQRIHTFNFRSNLIKTLGWLVVGVLFAFSMEAIQYLLPYRAFNINDLLANGLGVVLGFLFILFAPVILSLSKDETELKRRM